MIFFFLLIVVLGLTQAPSTVVRPAMDTLTRALRVSSLAFDS